jgi:hypothetical protein
LQAEAADYPETSDFARRLGHHTIVAVPLIRAGGAIGAIAVRRTEMRPSTDRQIDLLKTFAGQAVIATTMGAPLAESVDEYTTAHNSARAEAAMILGIMTLLQRPSENTEPS